MDGGQLRQVAVRSLNMDFSSFCEVIYLDTYEKVSGSRQAYLDGKYTKFCKCPMRFICELEHNHLDRAATLFKDIFIL